MSYQWGLTDEEIEKVLASGEKLWCDDGIVVLAEIACAAAKRIQAALLQKVAMKLIELPPQLLLGMETQSPTPLVQLTLVNSDLQQLLREGGYQSPQRHRWTDVGLAGTEEVD